MAAAAIESHAVEKPGEKGKTVPLVNAWYGAMWATARMASAVAIAHRPGSRANVTPAAAVKKMQNATTIHAGALVRNFCCAMVSNALARTSTPGMGIEE